MIDLKIYINKNEISSKSIINVFDIDQAEFEIISPNIDYLSSRKIELFLEDYEIPCVISDNGLIAKSQINNLFRESFGYSTLRLFIDDEFFIKLIFNISTNEEKFRNIKEMMTYLLRNNERILDLCFSRTKYKSSNDGHSEASFESIISLAEDIISTFEKKRNVLRQELRNTLELIKESANDTNFYNINPYDIIENLDQLYQGCSADSIIIFGKVYSLGAIQRESYINSYDLEENRVLLGGLISIKEFLLDIKLTISERSNQLTYDKEYEIIKPFYKMNSFMIEDLYVELATEGMVKRIDSMLDPIDELLYFFKKEIAVNFDGYILPKLSPFTRKSSFYLTIYKQLGSWYSLGNPNIGIDQDLTKIRSTSKIYELFTLYKIIDALHGDGWKVVRSVEDVFFKNFIPAEVEFHKDNSVLNIFYEKKIPGFTKETKHNDLVALNKNNHSSEYNYYNPDFIIKKENEGKSSYFILDSKYSNIKTLQNFGVLNKLYEKYFSNLAVYNQVDGVLEKQAIRSVNAIHPFGDKTITKWPSKLPKIIPDVSTILLSKHENGLDKILDLINE